MKISLIDIGSNLTHDSFDADRDAVVARALAAGVLRQIVTGTDVASSRQAALLAAASPSVLSSTAGVHPHHAQSPGAALREELTALLGRDGVVAVGECGLDYFRDIAPRAAQRAVFIAQLEIAVATRKPVFLHQRDAHQDFTAILRDFAGAIVGGVAHCFTEGAPELDEYLGLGLSIGVTGWVNDERRADQPADPPRQNHLGNRPPP